MDMLGTRSKVTMVCMEVLDMGVEMKKGCGF